MLVNVKELQEEPDLYLKSNHEDYEESNSRETVAKMTE